MRLEYIPKDGVELEEYGYTLVEETLPDRVIRVYYITLPYPCLPTNALKQFYKDYVNNYRSIQSIVDNIKKFHIHFVLKNTGINQPKALKTVGDLGYYTSLDYCAGEMQMIVLIDNYTGFVYKVDVYFFLDERSLWKRTR